MLLNLCEHWLSNSTATLSPHRLVPTVIQIKYAYAVELHTPVTRCILLMASGVNGAKLLLLLLLLMLTCKHFLLVIFKYFLSFIIFRRFFFVILFNLQQLQYMRGLILVFFNGFAFLILFLALKVAVSCLVIAMD